MADPGEFVIYADWQCLRAVDQGLLDAVDAEWDPLDESFCSSPSDDDPTVLVMSFDLTATSYEEAAEQGQRRVEQFAGNAPLDGTLLSVVAMDEEGSMTFTL